MAPWGQQMNKADQQLLERVEKILLHYNRASVRGVWFDAPKIRRQHVDYVVVSFILPILLVAVAYLVLPFIPPKPAAISVNLSAFILAVAASCILSGRQGAWVAAIGSLFLIAWIAPPDGSLAVDLEAVPWFVFACATFAVIAMLAPPGPRPPPLTRGEITPQPPYKNINQSQRRFIIRDRMSVFFLR